MFLVRLILFSSLLCCYFLQAEEVFSVDKPLTYDVSGSGAWAPYFMTEAEDHNYGIMPELMEALFTEAGLSVEPVNYPPKRTVSYLLKGELDMDIINLEWLPEDALRQPFVYSDNLIEVKEFYIARPGFNADAFFQQKAQKRQSVGMVRGYYYHNQSDYMRVDFPSEKALIEALKKERVDMIICGDLPALYWAKPQNIDLNLVKLHSKGHLKLRLRKELAPILPKLNQAIQKLHNNGTIEQILTAYTGSKKYN